MKSYLKSLGNRKVAFKQWHVSEGNTVCIVVDVCAPTGYLSGSVTPPLVAIVYTDMHLNTSKYIITVPRCIDRNLVINAIHNMTRRYIIFLYVCLDQNQRTIFISNDINDFFMWTGGRSWRINAFLVHSYAIVIAIASEWFCVFLVLLVGRCVHLPELT